ncbi:rRNA maturation RNase YbeY [Rasiella sp. SM2506]|uniref:rRNA maturation RNase YbeY n=1 Tax=Rasiella sp. SM2506 TaxID=3423914 RepID=UPI003D7B0242
MIEFYSENDFELTQEKEISSWISAEIKARDFEEGEIAYIFCDDEYLLKLNIQFLNHDTLTDIISFDNSLGTLVNGEIYISTERVAENAKEYETGFTNELHRVLIHGILHFCGLKDKSEQDAKAMRNEENTALRRRDFV